MADKVLPTIGTQSISGASGPSKAAPSTEYAKSDLGENIETVSDGDTDVVLSALGRGKEEPNFQGRDEKPHYPPCINPSCKSFGHSHPNCRCYAGPGGTSLEHMFAHGGCVGPHKEDCEHYADGGTIAENTMIHDNPQHTLDHVGVSHGLLGLLTKTGHSKSGKHIEEYVHHAKKGHKTVHSHMENIFTPHRIEADKNSREGLKNHLQMLREHPEKLLEVGGNLGSNLPAHGAHLAAKAGDVVNHFNAIRPVQSKQHPLDELSPVDKRDQALYDRHIDLAQNPSTILNHVKDGNLVPSDVSTMKAIYPELYKKMVDRAGEALITAKSKNMEIPYKTKQSLSLFLGQDLDSTMTPMAMQAIIKSAGPQQANNQAKAKPKKASGAELNQFNKVNAMGMTPLQERQSNRK